MLVLAILTMASMIVAQGMARCRHRSTEFWLWTSAFIGPLGPLALFILGDRYAPRP
jgi:hypothetical protein